MNDRIEAIAVPQAATAYVRPSALIFTVEGGRHVLYAVRCREEALRLLAEKRARTREERYKLSLEILEASVLPERSDVPSARIASPAVGLLMDAAFRIMPHLEDLQDLVYHEEPGLDAFVLPYAPEIESGFGVVRTHAGPLLEMFHSREHAVAFLERHEAVIAEDDLADAADGFGYSPLVARSRRPPEAFGGFAAALIGSFYRLRTLTRRASLKR